MRKCWTGPKNSRLPWEGKSGGRGEDGRIVEAKIDLFAVWKLDHEELAEMGAEVLDRFVAGEEDTPVLGPGLLDQGVERGDWGGCE